MGKRPKFIGREGKWRDREGCALLCEVQEGDPDENNVGRRKLYYDAIWSINKDTDFFWLIESFQPDHPRAQELRAKTTAKLYKSRTVTTELDKKQALEFAQENGADEDVIKLIKQRPACRELREAWERFSK